MNLTTPVINVQDRDGALWIRVLSENWLDVTAELFSAGFIRGEWLKGVHLGEETFAIYLEVTNSDSSKTCIVSTIISSEIASISDIYPAVDFHERECMQMLGIKFSGRQPTASAFVAEFDGFPLRRDFPLEQRMHTAWPGQADPEKAVRRRPVTPPGVHKEWSS